MLVRRTEIGYIAYPEHLFLELPSIVSSRTVSPVQSLSPENEAPSNVSSTEPRSPSPKEEEPWVMFTRHRTHSDAQYEHTEV